MKRNFTKKEVIKIVNLYNEYYSIKEICVKLNCGIKSIYGILKKILINDKKN